MSEKTAENRDRLSEVFLDEATIPRGAIDLDHERAVAIFDLIEDNVFGVPGRDDGPYTLTISQEESKLTFDIRTSDGEQAASIVVSMTPFRPLLKDYFLVCEDLLFRHPHRQPPADRGDRSRAERASQRRRGSDGAAPVGETDDRPDHGAPALHPGVDVALEDMIAAAPTTRDFIVANTRLRTPPLVPEVRLRLADEAVPIWKKTEEELGAIGLPPPFWAFAWAGGQALARYVLDNRALVARGRVLDFASGSGLVGIAATLAGAERVEASDVDAFAVTAIALNAAENGVAVAPRLEDLVGADEGWSVVLAGDVAYERGMSEAVTAWLASLAARGATVLIGDPGRAYLALDRLERLIDYRVPVTRELEDAEIKRTGVFRFR